MQTNHAAAPGAREEAAVLTEATVNAAEKLGINGATLARILFVSPAFVSGMKKGEKVIDPNGAPFQVAAHFVRLFRSLDAVTGGDADSNRSWLASMNTVLRTRPIDLIQNNIAGLIRTVAYLDSRRAKI